MQASEPLLILGFGADANDSVAEDLPTALATALADFGVVRKTIDRKLEVGAIRDLVANVELVIVAVEHPESAGVDVTRLVDQVVGVRGRERVVVAVPKGTVSAALLDLDRRQSVLLTLGRRLGPGSTSTQRLRKRVAAGLIAVQPLDLPASLYRTAIQQRSVEVLAENLSLAASRPIRDWELARPEDHGLRPNPLWSSWLAASHELELARLGRHLDELRVQMLLGDDHEGNA